MSDMKRLKEAREKQGLSVRDLAIKVDVHYSSISLWENGKRNPKAKQKIKLEKILNMKAEELLKDVE